jgi:peptide deformylase
MAKVLPLVLAPDPLLHEVSKPVEKVSDEIRALMDDMLKTMYAENGIGLAAVQVGHLKRILVMDVNYEAQDCCDHHHHDVKVENSNPLYLVNPEIIESSSELESFNEGCLSFPGARAEVSRPKKVKIKYLDYHGNQQIKEMDGILAICVQHEMDHLDGITFVDHISRLKREMIIKKMIKLQR